VPVRRFVTTLRLPALYQLPRQSYWTSDTLLLRVLTTASYENSLDFPSLLRRLPVPRTRTAAFDAESVRASLPNRKITPRFTIRDPFSDGPLSLVDGPVLRALCQTKAADGEDDREEGGDCDPRAEVHRRANSKAFHDCVSLRSMDVLSRLLRTTRRL
jgi:hypothetical protein